jgi:hypothetical protein
LSTIPQHQWASKLLGFDFQVEYKPGATNVVADALSRHDTESATTMAISSSSFELFDNLGWEIEEDPDFCSLRAGTHDKDWHVTDGLVLVAGRIYLPGTSSTVSLACATTHGARHEGVAKTLHRLRADFHVPGACTLVAEFVYACAMCHRNKAEQLHPMGLLQPLDNPSMVWADISMDVTS